LRFLRIAAIALIVVFLALQVVRPERTNPSSDPAHEIQAPRNVKRIIERSCYDCHSNETHWPWYSNIAPMSWALVEDVNEGRDELSFSEWNAYSASRRSHLLEEICEQVEKGEMPLTPYTLMHPSAKLTIEDKRALCVWAGIEGGGGNHGRGRGRGGRQR
jgi:hypothetical protein